jgi:hypothetical protein
MGRSVEYLPMNGTEIAEIYLNSATRERGYTWYRLVKGEAGQPAEYEPESYSVSLRSLIPHDSPTALLYQDGRPGHNRWGVFWGPMPTGQRDWIGRNILFRLLAELPDLATAAGLFAGILRDWWPERNSGLDNLGRLVTGALDGSPDGPSRMIDFLVDTLRNWCTTEPARVSGPVVENGPRLAPPTPVHLQALGDYLRGPFRESSLVKSPAYSVVVIALVTEGVVDDRFHNFWRVLNDTTKQQGWAPNGSQGVSIENKRIPHGGQAGSVEPQGSPTHPLLDFSQSEIVAWIRQIFRRYEEDFSRRYGGMGHLDPELQELAERLVYADAGDDRVRAAEALGQRAGHGATLLSGPEVDLVMDVLLKALEPSSDSPPRVIRAVVQALGNIGPRAIRVHSRLIELTADPSVAAAAQEALKRIG